MTCRDFRDAVDLLLSDELLMQTNHEVLQHLGGCPPCRAELEVRRRLRSSLKRAFDQATDLQPTTAFVVRLRHDLRTAFDAPEQNGIPGRWLAVAAAVIVAAGLTGFLFMSRAAAPIDALARDAIGDHWNCALKNRRIRTPVPLADAAVRFDRAYGRLLTAPPEETSTPFGPARVVDRHSCAFGERRFGHVVLAYRRHVVSLLVTADDAESGGGTRPADLVPRLHGAPVSGLSVASIRGAHHAILLVSDLDERDLTQLATRVSVPLVERLASSALPMFPRAMTASTPHIIIEPVTWLGPQGDEFQ